MRKDHATLPNIYAVNYCPNLPTMDLWPGICMTLHHGKVRQKSEFLKITQYWIRMTLIPGDTKHHCGPPGTVMEVRSLMEFYLRTVSQGSQVFR